MEKTQTTQTVIIQGLKSLQDADGVLKRAGLEVVAVPTLEAAVARLETAPPRLLLVELASSRTAIAALTERLKALGDLAPRVVFLRRGSASRQLLERVAAVSHAVTVTGKERFMVRVWEAVAHQLGLQVRRHFRHTGLEAEAAVLTPHARAPLRLINLSASGAQLHGEAKLALGSACRLELTWSDDGPPLVLQAKVNRISTRPQGDLEFAVAFVEMTPAQEQRLRGLWSDPELPSPPFTPPRSATRRLVPKKMSLQLRLHQPPASRRSYLKVIDISEGGLLARCEGYVPACSVGDEVVADLICPQLRAQVRARVVRLSTSGDGCQVALRFWLPRRGNAEFTRLLALVRDHGLAPPAAAPVGSLVG
ncbi:MAG: PilZ domain-containing protein [Archangiaceae bacterium]|nr:PilZ domain-containing protein [Archangiaceae bacterium]